MMSIVLYLLYLVIKVVAFPLYIIYVALEKFKFWCTQPFVKRRNKKKRGTVQIHKESIQEEIGTFDPFAEIARNGQDIAIYEHGNSVKFSAALLASINRISKAHKSLGNALVTLFIGQEEKYREDILLKSETRVFHIPMEDDRDVLKSVLELKKTLLDVDKNTIVHLSHRPANRVGEEMFDEYISYILPTIASVPNGICLVVIPYKTLQRDQIAKLESMRQEIPGLKFQYLYLEDYNNLHGQKERLVNTVLFPMYYYSMDNYMADNATTFFSKVKKEYITLPYWDYFQMIYETGQTSGVYFMEEHELSGE